MRKDKGEVGLQVGRSMSRKEDKEGGGRGKEDQEDDR
jgi:hypothetical protein